MSIYVAIRLNMNSILLPFPFWRFSQLDYYSIGKLKSKDTLTHRYLEIRYCYIVPSTTINIFMDLQKNKKN